MQRSHARRRRSRRANYSMMLALVVVVLLGFGALAIDIAYMRLAQAQAQDVADAASQAALIILRQTGDQTQAEAGANLVVSQNHVVGESPALDSIEFGNWDDTLADPEFETGGATAPNAVKVTVGRHDDGAVDFLLGKVFDQDTFDVSGTAVSATRSFQIAFVLDITGSWGEAKFADARDAMLVSLDMLAESASGVDEIAMTIFTNRFSWEYTPFTVISIPTNAAAVRDDWEVLNIASKAPRGSYNADPYDGVRCDSSYGNNFSSPAGGCYPEMPREYTDEPGTDHSTGMLQAKQMFEERTSTAAYRAMIIVTDGRPNGLGAASGTIRASSGYTEDRWREYMGPVPRTRNQIRSASIDAAQDLWLDLGVHTWLVSLVAYDARMMQDPPEDQGPTEVGPGVPQGDGYYRIASSSDELVDILSQIISEMPLAIVE